MSVNGASLNRVSHDRAAEILKNAVGEVEIVVSQFKSHGTSFLGNLLTFCHLILGFLSCHYCTGVSVCYVVLSCLVLCCLVLCCLVLCCLVLCCLVLCCLVLCWMYVCVFVCFWLYFNMSSFISSYR